MSTRAERQMLPWYLLQRGLAVCLVIPALLIALLAGALIRLRSPGVILLRTTREGKDGARFSMYKLRTMIVDADVVLARSLAESDAVRREWLQYGRLACDPRIAGSVARWARRFSIDELPQILNIVFGQMSFVGPRPLPLEVVATMRREYRLCRQKVLPGMTGLWQVSGRSELSINAMGRLDRIYVRKRCVALDLAILLRTVRTVVNSRGAY